MLGDSKVIATIAVSNLDDAKRFYGQVLGLNQIDENPGGVGYESGGGQLFVYLSDTAGMNQATSANWIVDDIDAKVMSLKEAGIEFDHYELPDTVVEGDIHIMGDMKAAWFRDPDGNILALSNG